MNVLSDAVRWLNDPLNWSGDDGILALLGQHVYIAGLAVLLGCLVAWPVGIWLGHTGQGGGFIVILSNVTLAIPTLALLTLLPLTFLGFGAPAVVVALAVFAIPPLLANAFTGVREVDSQVIDAARGIGLSRWQVLSRVQLPLAVPYLAAGFRTAAVQVVATATLAAYVNGGGLGLIIRRGFGQQEFHQVLVGGVLVALLALLVEAVLALVQRSLTPVHMRRVRRRRRPAPEAAPAG